MIPISLLATEASEPNEKRNTHQNNATENKTTTEKINPYRVSHKTELSDVAVPNPTKLKN